MAGDTTTYNYQALDSFVQQLSKAAGNIDNEIQNMVSQTKKTYGQYFTGSAADDYNNRANQIHQLLSNKMEQLLDASKKVSNGSDAMQQTDSRGAKQISGN